MTIKVLRFGNSRFGFRRCVGLRITLALVVIIFKQMVFVDIINDLVLISVIAPFRQRAFALQRG